MTGHVLVLGGARSGKTAFAEALAIRSGRKPAYLATAEALDAEMRDRVASHKAGRADRFTTIEEPLALSDALVAAAKKHDVIGRADGGGEKARCDPGGLPDAVDHQPAGGQ